MPRANDDGILSVGAATDATTGQPVPDANSKPAIPTLTIGNVTESPQPVGLGLNMGESNANGGPSPTGGVSREPFAFNFNTDPTNTKPYEVQPDDQPAVPTAPTPNVWDGMLELAGGVITQDEEAVPVEPWDGDPTKPVLPGEIVYYWLPCNRPGLLVPHVAMLLGRTPGGGYKGILFWQGFGGVKSMSAAVPSLTPKRGHFTRRSTFPVAMCRE